MPDLRKLRGGLVWPDGSLIRERELTHQSHPSRCRILSLAITPGTSASWLDLDRDWRSVVAECVAAFTEMDRSDHTR